MYGELTAQSTKILYGGSVNPQNIEALLREAGIDGGNVVAQGEIENIKENDNSITGNYSINFVPNTTTFQITKHFAIIHLPQSLRSFIVRTTWRPLSNETKPLTFLLSLIFLFLFNIPSAVIAYQI